jgi:hypothetical protein
MKPTDPSTATIATSTGMGLLVANASGRNRSVHEVKFLEELDPGGIHVLCLNFPHNGVEMRTQWACKMKDTNEPTFIWLDVDFKAMREYTNEMILKDSEG